MSSRVVRSWKQENAWPCNSCGAINLGRDMSCVKCGSRKEDDEQYVVPAADPSQAVVDPQLLDFASRGPNWKCPYCNGHERDGNGVCIGCGGQRHEEDHPSEPPEAGREEEEPRHERRERREPMPMYQSSPDDDQPVRRRGLPLPAIFGIGLGAISLILFLCWFFIPHKVEAEVSSVRWEYTAELRQKTLMHGEDWGNRTSGTYFNTAKSDGYGPRDDSFNVMCEGRRSGTENCNPYDCNFHEVSYDCNCQSYDCNCTTHKSCTDKGNGFSDCSEVESCSTCNKCDTCTRTEHDTCYHQCDVYKDWCTYDYYDWPVVATEKTSGQDLNVYWPKLEAKGADQRLDKTEVYDTILVREDKTWKYEPKSLNEFKTFPSGARWLIKVNRAGQVWPISSIN